MADPFLKTKSRMDFFSIPARKLVYGAEITQEITTPDQENENPDQNQREFDSNMKKKNVHTTREEKGLKWKQKRQTKRGIKQLHQIQKGQILLSRSNFFCLLVEKNGFFKKKNSENCEEIAECGISEEAGSSVFFADNFFFFL